MRADGQPRDASSRRWRAGALTALVEPVWVSSRWGAGARDSGYRERRPERGRAALLCVLVFCYFDRFFCATRLLQ